MEKAGSFYSPAWQGTLSIPPGASMYGMADSSSSRRSTLIIGGLLPPSAHSLLSPTGDLLPLHLGVEWCFAFYSFSHYGNVNVTGPLKLIGSGAIRRCGFIGVGVALLEEVCQCGVRL